MCGIFGFIFTNSENINKKFIDKSITKLFKLSQSRGKDASGLAIRNSIDRKIYLYKRNLSASCLLSQKQYKDFFNTSLHSIFKNRAGLCVIGHCRMETNGCNEIEDNNQPVSKNGRIVAHNGIITNTEEIWTNNTALKQDYQIDTELIIELMDFYIRNKHSYDNSIAQLFNTIYGETTFVMLSNDNDKLVLASNTGSLYLLSNEEKGLFIFASEKNILNRYKADFSDVISENEVLRVNPGCAVLVDMFSMKKEYINFNKIDGEHPYIKSDNKYDIVVNNRTESHSIRFNSNTKNKSDQQLKAMLEYNVERIRNLKRCTKCLLPETFPFIKYDDQGVCNYCRNYEIYKPIGITELKNRINSEILHNTAEKRLLITFSGGRDSSYGLHYLSKELGLETLTYTYDWGMVTDLARRNQSRLCGKLGIEHIIVSANIEKKRRNIHKNVSAWLRKPSLGTIPLFMAGDKQYFYYAQKVAKQNGLSNLIILCDNPLEVTYFKFGFAGVVPNFEKKGQLFSISLLSQIKMVYYYAKEFLSNPRYLNSSLIDSFGAFASYYLIDHNYINLYRFINWDEEEVEKTLIQGYDWELAPDTQTTWRIGDGTAPFYNYIYYTVAGFSENETLRSNQIRQGIISREEGLKLAERDNKPRFESIKWYLDTIGVEYEYAIKKINAIPKLYK